MTGKLRKQQRPGGPDTRGAVKNMSDMQKE